MTTAFDPDFLSRLLGDAASAPRAADDTGSAADDLADLIGLDLPPPPGCPGGMDAPDDLTTKQLARILGIRRLDLRAAAARLGLVPGVEVVTGWRGPRVTRIWPLEWVEELRAEVGRREWDWTALV